MNPLRFILSVLALAGTAFAVCDNDTYTIQSDGDLPAGCSTLNNIVIAKGAAGTINLAGLARLKGSLTCDGAINLVGISAPDLRSIDGDFELNRLTILSSLVFPQLTSVGAIQWQVLPGLTALTFTSQVKMAGSVVISDTGLTSLNGINLVKVDEFNINNNRYLNTIDVQLNNITGPLNIEANGQNNLAVRFPNLQWAFNMTFRNCSSVTVPSLASVNGSMGFTGNMFQSFSAPNLTKIGESLFFVYNTQLSNISLPELTTVGGGFQLANNTELLSVSFPLLSTVGGAVDFSGAFTDVTLAGLTDVKGGFNVQSSADKFSSCTDLDKYKNSVIKGSYFCSGKISKPGSIGTSPTASSGTASKTGAAGHLEANNYAMMGSTGLLAGLLQFLL